MRIRLEAPGQPPYWLSGNPALNPRTEQSEAMQEGINITRQQQAVPGAEFAVQTFIDRSNQAVTITATTHRIFADEADRMEHISRLAPVDQTELEHQFSGAVWLRADRPNGAYKEFCLPNAVVSISGTRPEGEVGLYVTYSIRAGGFKGTQEGSVNIVELGGFLNITPAVAALTFDDLDPLMESMLVNGYIEVTVTNASGNTLSAVVARQYGFETLEILAVCQENWESVHGPGLVVYDAGTETLNVTAEGLVPYASILVYNNAQESVFQSTEEGGPTDFITLLGDDGEPLIGDIG